MFKFPLQRVLELRARREQEVAQELAEARASADRARSARDTLEQARLAGAGHLAETQSDGCTIGQLHNLTFVLELFDRHLHEVRGVVRQAEQQVEKCLDDFTTASQERRVIERLRERHHASWLAEEVQEDRKAMDAIALTRFVRSASGQPSARTEP